MRPKRLTREPVFQHRRIRVVCFCHVKLTRAPVQMVIPDNDNDDDDDVGDDVDDGVKGGGRELHAYNNHYEPQMLGPPDPVCI